jgi:hypothetical protein
MGNNFILFGDKRIKLSVIKKYEAYNSGNKFGVKIFYAVGAKPQNEPVWFDSELQRDKALGRLDNEFGVA